MKKPVHKIYIDWSKSDPEMETACGKKTHLKDNILGKSSTWTPVDCPECIKNMPESIKAIMGDESLC